MDKQSKIWGETSLILETPSVSVHLLRIEAGGYCSEHRHERKANHFFVIYGRLAIRQWRNGEADVTTLDAGESLKIPVGGWHQFEALDQTLALEIYEAAPVEEDIIRRSVGGVRRDRNEAGIP
jgi:mannose-6-phosphate isomerase